LAAAPGDDLAAAPGNDLAAAPGDDLAAAPGDDLAAAPGDDLAAAPGDVDVHEWQKEKLDRRKANLMSKPASGLSWEQVKKRISK
jgi:putative addiction module component (TIGR02574 family)